MDNQSLSNVKEVLGVATRKDGSQLTGQGKKGPWTMMSVILENGVKLNVFAPVKVGDMIYDLVQDDTYHSWSGKVKSGADTTHPNTVVHDASQPTNAQILDAIRTLYKLVDERTRIDDPADPLTSAILDKPVEKIDAAGRGNNREPVELVEDYIVEDINEPINLDDIPF